MTESQVLLCDDDAAVLEAYCESIELEGLTVRPCRSVAEVLPLLATDVHSVVVTDVRMPDADGFDLLAAAHAIDADTPVILMTGHGDIPMALRALRAGAWDFIEKPADPVILVETVRRALDHRAIVLENRRLRWAMADPASWGGRILGESAAARHLRERLQRLANVPVDVLLVGETGTGKEVAARAIHDFSSRSAGKFVAINCGALPETVLESELFGHEPGSFTGAKERRIGKIEYASGGTLFLDEIESMPLLSQVHLLRVLQERSVVRLGSNIERPVDLRVITATKKSLTTLAEVGAFREDLAYRLDIARLDIPPLRQRAGDVIFLFLHFLDLAARRLGCAPPAIDVATRARLQAHDWPGNIRELRNVAERYVLGLDDVFASSCAPSLAAVPAATLEAQVDRAERGIIIQALAEQDGRIGDTAKLLSISRKTLYLKMRKFGLSAVAGVPEEE